MNRARLRALAALAALVLAGALAPASRAADAPPIRGAVTLTPGRVKVGERVRYRGYVTNVNGPAKWVPPRSGGAFAWGTIKTWRTTSKETPNNVQTSRPGPTPMDTSWVEVALQAFEPGLLSIPGMRFRGGGGADAEMYQLPIAKLAVVSSVAALDSSAQLRPVHGPLRAPWWERVAWIPILIGLAVAVLFVWLAFWLRRKLRKPVVVPVRVVPPAPRRDPTATALNALSALRKEKLPEAGQFDEHAFRLTQILRRYLEAIAGTPRPGDTSSELVAHLRGSRLAEDDLRRLEGLLSVWDRVKFARAPFSIEEAQRSEQAVESLVRGPDADVPRVVA